ncbi:tetratricopeptide repeat-containing sulfotransferase family protein [Sandarakinorhabdus sp.]|uniref:tetratricopeptide repeat-containing sulfotransferase family protein n=1 Tax=Sandarakinorhabdus sp. TaxID=1916663 RepID=UPI003F72AE76
MTAARPDVATDPREMDQALASANLLLDTDPLAALAATDALLATAPGLPQAELLAGQALRRLGRSGDALQRLDALAARHPRVPAVTWELANAASDHGDHPAAIQALQRLTEQLPAVPGGWFMLGRELRAVGRDADAWRADLSGVNAATNDPELLKAALAMSQGQLADAAAQLQARLARDGNDPPAIRLLGETLWRRGDMSEAIAAVERAVAMAPGFDLAREFLIRLLMQSNRLTDALVHAEALQGSPLQAPGHRLILASVLVRLGEQERARALYEGLLAAAPAQPLVWQNLGHVLKTLGVQADAVHAYRQAVTHQPTLGEAWWSLANLKTVKLTAGDIATMNAALGSLTGQDDAPAEDIFHLHFSLGKAHEDAGNAAAAFRHYSEGNRRRRAMIRHDADAFSAEISDTIAGLTAPLLATSGGCPARDPIFIVGLPRSGSTLIEQILASHSHVEGTMELPEMMMIGSRLQARIDDGEFANQAAMLASLTPADRRRLGEEYLDRTRVHRKTDRPLFIDKMPNNWQHAGLIKLILPNATIIDARRHPMGCCFSAWKQHFARGQSFSYDLVDVGRYYRDYVRMMAHIEAVMPGAVHRVIYEQMVVDTETQVTRLLEAVGVDFEPACLTFWQTDRAVRTASSEQVRQPIFTDGVDHWKRFADWLGPLADTLGDVSSAYPAVPPSLRAI